MLLERGQRDVAQLQHGHLGEPQRGQAGDVEGEDELAGLPAVQAAEADEDALPARRGRAGR